MYLKDSLAFWSILWAANVWAAPILELGEFGDHGYITRDISKRAQRANQTTILLPDTFAISNSSAFPPRKYTLTYSHDKINVQTNTSLIAVHFGVADLNRALDAAIDNATSQARTVSKQRQTQFNAVFNHLSLIVTPAADIPQPLSLSWVDFATILRILRNDTLQRPTYSTLFVGMVTDTSGNNYAHVAVLPELVFISPSAPQQIVKNLNRTASTQPSSLGNPSRGLQWDPAGNGDNSESSDHENLEYQGANNETEAVERLMGVTRDGPPVDGTDLRMHVRENRGHRIASDRLREAYNSLRDSVALLPEDDTSALISGGLMSPMIALRRPENSVFAEFGVMDLTYYFRDDLQLTSRELHAVFAALDVLVSRLDRVAFPPSIEIYREGEHRMIAFLYFWHQSPTDGGQIGGTQLRNDLIARPVTSGTSSEQVGPPTPGVSSNSATTGHPAVPSNQPYSSIFNSGTWESISQQLQAYNQRRCQWWTICFTGSWPQPFS